MSTDCGLHADGAHLAAAAQRVPSVRSELAATFRTALHSAFPAVAMEPIVAATNNPKFGDYQCNNAMQLFGRMKGKVGHAPLKSHTPNPPLKVTCDCAG